MTISLWISWVVGWAIAFWQTRKAQKLEERCLDLELEIQFKPVIDSLDWMKNIISAEK